MILRKRLSTENKCFQSFLGESRRTAWIVADLQVKKRRPHPRVRKLDANEISPRTDSLLTSIWMWFYLHSDILLKLLLLTWKSAAFSQDREKEFLNCEHRMSKCYRGGGKARSIVSSIIWTSTFGAAIVLSTLNTQFNSANRYAPLFSPKLVEHRWTKFFV